MRFSSALLALAFVFSVALASLSQSKVSQLSKVDITSEEINQLATIGVTDEEELKKVSVQDWISLGLDENKFGYIITALLNCPKACQHGGVLKADCSGCDNCVPGWTGAFCDQWKGDGAKDEVDAYLELNAKNAQVAYENSKKPPHLPLLAGFGYDAVANLLKLPVYEFTFNAKTWTSPAGTFTLPEEATFTDLSTKYKTPVVTNKIYSLMSEYVADQKTAQTSLKSTGGLYSLGRTLEQVQKAYFVNEHGLALSANVHQLYTVQVNTNTAKLNRFVRLALLALPHNYHSKVEKYLYSKYFKYWGSHVVHQLTAAGIAEHGVAFDRDLSYNKNFFANQAPISVAAISNEALHEFQNMANGGNINILPAYTAHRNSVGMNCYGGNPALKCNVASRDKWLTSVVVAPAATNMVLQPVAASFPKNADAFNALAADTFATHFAKWNSLPSCPACKNGKCAAPKSACGCNNGQTTGIRCDACLPTWSGPTCVNPVCNGGCGHGVCQSPGKCKCNANFAGAHCEKCAPGWAGGACNVPVCTANCSGHGRCVSPGMCQCDQHFTGAWCSMCTSGWSGPFCNTPTCMPACNHGGRCTAPNTCSCSGHFQGPTCNSCIYGYQGYNCDQPVCMGGCGHGRCTSPGMCQCDFGWSGSNCNMCTGYNCH